ncbi:sensor histidine kinase [Fodinicola acaciae]|uniref:sensor histidine kinase n=1 Tax=Fodinicola acaciae TaxID=2681555 RepID=UPI0013D5DD95|nr:HAMP domain-containing sensor histidine kinase [Fodinicola acaciae]
MIRRQAGATEASLVHRAARRLALQVAGTVAVVVVLLTGVAVSIVVREQHTAADSLLQRAATTADDVGDPPAGMYLAIRSPHGLARTPGTPSGAFDTAAITRVSATGAAEFADRHASGTEFRMFTVRRPGRTVQAVLDLTADHKVRTQLVSALVGAGVAGLLLASLLAAWVSRRVVQPLSDALHLQRRFVADASHELRTPLTLLSARAQLLDRLSGADTGSAYRAEVAGLVDDARQLAGTLDDLLAAADPRGAGPPARLDLALIAASVVAASAGFADDRRISLRDESDGPVPVVGGPVALRRAITALVHNGVRHADSSVVVRVSRERTNAVVEVIDDGPGIDPAVLPRLFGRFVSGAGATRRSGLGLALVSDIAHRHGGAVSTRSRPGQTVFSLVLPLADRS